jgi:hypothetical protein
VVWPARGVATRARLQLGRLFPPSRGDRFQKWPPRHSGVNTGASWWTQDRSELQTLRDRATFPIAADGWTSIEAWSDSNDSEIAAIVELNSIAKEGRDPPIRSCFSNEPSDS